MRVLLGELSTTPSGSQTRREKRLDVEALTIGRSTESHVVLPSLSMSLHHSRIAHQRGESIVECTDGTHVRINGRRVRRGAVAPGDLIRIGRLTLRVAEPGVAEDLHVEVEESSDPGDERKTLADHTRVGVESGWLTKRRLSWAFATLMFAAFCVLPLSTGWTLWSWSSGELARKHGFIADDCHACHALPFQPVANAECIECHSEVGRHIRHDVETVLSDRRCAECHPEHNAGERLVESGSSTCVACHARIERLAPGTELSVVTDFGVDHPEFRLSVVAEPGRDTPQRVRAGPEVRERSGVRFNHLRHVGQLVTFPEGGKGILDCGRCHELDAEARYFEPVDFELHCRSCHQLTFDLGVPDKEALHGDPAAMREELQAFYSARVLAGRVGDPGAPAEVRFMRPGRTMSPREEAVVSRWVEGRVARAESHLMDTPGECMNCHALVAGGASDGGIGIAPVELAEVWLPGSGFSHTTHAPFPCRECHPAAAIYDDEESPDVPRPDWSLEDAHPYALISKRSPEGQGIEASKVSEDVLIPGRDRCLSCHLGPEAQSPAIPSECMLCHPFHRAENGPMQVRSP